MPKPTQRSQIRPNNLKTKSIKKKKKSSNKKLLPTAIKVSAGDVFSKSTNVVYRNLDENTITVLSLDDPEFYFKIDSYAAKCWELIDGHKNLAQISDEISKLSGATIPLVQKEVLFLIKKLISFKLICKVK